MTITVLDGYTLNPGDNPWAHLETLAELRIHDRTPPQLILERAADSEILLTNKTPLTSETLVQLPRLRYIGVLATGYNVVDVAAARQRGIVVTNVPEYGTDSVAQHVFALLLALVNRVSEHDAAVKAGQWQRSGDFSFTLAPLTELTGKTLGIVGYGRIGRRVGEIARAFGMHLIASIQHEPASNARTQRPPTETGGSKAPDHTAHHPIPRLPLPQLFAQADVITLHCPQTPGNTGFFNRPLLQRMKPTALLLNTARGGLVNEADLAAALQAGELAGAGLDVVSLEPIRDDNPLLHAPNCLITPHMAWATVEARRRLMRIAAENVQAFLEGKPVNVVGG